MSVALVRCATSIHEQPMFCEAEVQAAALFPSRAMGNCFTANVDDAEKGIFRLTESDLESMKRAVISGNRGDDVQKPEGVVGSSTAVERFGGVGEDVIAQEKIEGQESEDILKSTITSTAVFADDGASSGAKEMIVPASKVGNRTQRDTGHERIIEKNYEDYPQGWPRLAAFLNTSSTLAVWRRFGTAHNRVLLHLQATITRLEQQLDELDKADAKDPARLYRLRRNEWREGWDTAQKDILEEMHRKLVEYETEGGQMADRNFCSDELLLKDSQLRSLTPAPVREYIKVFDWIYGVKPVDIGQYDFIYHRGDFVCSAKREKNVFDDFIKSCVSRWPNSRFQCKTRTVRKVLDYLCRHNDSPNPNLPAIAGRDE
ncbi:uncharacterized protein PAC_04096 [Phialocephala subalpina]|uniref:DUF6594 domain-containing protein n=1 Tax=Phialocephala subalpina TaxID=576137 RepID=A0A1L7WN81_9HELO|nr:uncharacterized protein PAC_04096 [Phialocephala subalpina]